MGEEEKEQELMLPMDLRKDRQVKYSLSDSYQYQKKEQVMLMSKYVSDDCSHSLSKHASPNQMMTRPRHRKYNSHSHSYQSSHSGNMGGDILHNHNHTNDSLQNMKFSSNNNT